MRVCGVRTYSLFYMLSFCDKNKAHTCAGVAGRGPLLHERRRMVDARRQLGNELGHLQNMGWVYTCRVVYMSCL